MPQQSESWLRKNVVSLAALVVSILALAMPWLVSVVEKNAAMSASIVGVTDNAVVSVPELEVSVQYDNKKDETDLWLVLRSGVEGNWYPQTRVIPAHNALRSGVSEKVNVLLGTPGPFQLSVYATTPSQGSTFREYMDQSDPPTGLVGLPDGITRLTTVSFTRDR